MNFRAEPDSAELYYRWCNPETALSEAIEGKLLEWARNFYYGVYLSREDSIKLSKDVPKGRNVKLNPIIAHVGIGEEVGKNGHVDMLQQAVNYWPLDSLIDCLGAFLYLFAISACIVQTGCDRLNTATHESGIKEENKMKQDGRENALCAYEQMVARVVGMDLLENRPDRDDDCECIYIDSIQYDSEGSFESVTIDNAVYEDSEDLLQNIYETPLELTVDRAKGTYMFLLTCGGPHLELVGTLDRHDTPNTANLEYSWMSEDRQLPVDNGKLVEWANYWAMDAM